MNCYCFTIHGFKSLYFRENLFIFSHYTWLQTTLFHYIYFWENMFIFSYFVCIQENKKSVPKNHNKHLATHFYECLNDSYHNLHCWQAASTSISTDGFMITSILIKFVQFVCFFESILLFLQTSYLHYIVLFLYFQFVNVQYLCLIFQYFFFL